jgi:hypothetical protein
VARLISCTAIALFAVTSAWAQKESDNPYTDFNSAFLDARYSGAHFFAGSPITEYRGGGFGVGVSYEGPLIALFAGEVKKFLIGDYLQVGFGLGGQSTRRRPVSGGDGLSLNPPQSLEGHTN